MSGAEISGTRFRIQLDLQVPGPIRGRSKHKVHRLRTASRSITLPYAM